MMYISDFLRNSSREIFLRILGIRKFHSINCILFENFKSRYLKSGKDLLIKISSNDIREIFLYEDNFFSLRNLL